MNDRVRVEGLAFDAIIGVLPEERVRVQPLRFDLELGLDLRPAGISGKISDTVDYDRVAREVTALVQFRRYRLIEAAAEESAAMLLGLHPALHEVVIRLQKPEALGRARGIPSVSISRNKDDYPRRFETSTFGQVEILLESRDAGLYLLHVEPGRSIPLHRHHVMRELEWVVEGELVQNERVLPLVHPAVWPGGSVHGYENRSRRRASVFCCDCPPFIPADEIVVEHGVTG